MKHSHCSIVFFCVGNAVQTLKSSDSVKVITVRGTAFEAAATSGGSGTTEAGQPSLTYYLQP